ncbi:PIG-L family deacetylase [Streptomyces erythrochromogenes]|uniref:PIG-L family deacetylase n=1 Tax=Streptomyces erythrochromogenes TaxID=285574 RepID=UPI00341C148A
MNRSPRSTLRARAAVAAATLAVGVSATALAFALPGHGAASAAADAPAKPTASATSAAAAAESGPVRVVDFVAHPDDDLYFMNPEIRQSITAGQRLTTVYLTSGASDGRNIDGRDEKKMEARHDLPAPDRPGYALARQNGIRAAYAQMATGSRTSPWTRSTVPTAGGGAAELDVLRARPGVRLLWLELREAGSIHGDAPVSMHGLWDGRTPVLPSQLVTGGPVTKPFSYTRAGFVDTLTGVLDSIRPTLVRTQDPTPGGDPNADHQDHIYGARFAQAALARYAATVPVPQRPHFTVQTYLGYQSGQFRPALSPADAQLKLGSLLTYGWLDRVNDCGSPVGCGDLKIATRPEGYGNWAGTIRYARSTGTSWLSEGPDGTATAFGVLDGQAAVWRRPGPDAAWTGPQLLPGTGIDQAATVVRLPGGGTALFATRTTGSGPADYHREVVYTVGNARAQDFGAWHSLSAPDTAGAQARLDISAPAVTVDGSGRLHVYIRDGDLTLRERTGSADGSWGPWTHRGGTGVRGTPVAVEADGRAFVFASTTKSVLVWSTPGQNGPDLGPAAPTGLPATTLPLTAAASGADARLYFRSPGSGEVLTAVARPGGRGADVSLLAARDGAQGYGPVTETEGVLAGRTGTGALGVSAPGAAGWQTTPVLFSGAPSSAPDGSMVDVAVVGADARLHVSAVPATPSG